MGFDYIYFLRMRIKQAQEDAEKHAEGTGPRLARERVIRRYERQLLREMWKIPPPFDDAEINLAEDRTLN